MTDDNRRKKAQAVFFSLVMVLSMVGGTVALAGGAAATVQDFDGITAGDVEAGQDSTVEQVITLQNVENDGNADTIEISNDASGLDDTVIDQAGAADGDTRVSASNGHSASVSSVQSNGTIVVDLASGSASSDNIQVTAELDLSSYQDKTIQYTAESQANTISQTTTFDITVAQPDYDSAVIPETNPDTLEVTFDEDVQADGTDTQVTNAFTIGGATVSGASVNGFSEIKNGDTVVLDLSANVASDDSGITVKYDGSGHSNPISNNADASVDALDFSGESVTSDADPVIASAKVDDGDKDLLKITTSENVDANGLAADAFSLGDSQADITGVNTATDGSTSIDLNLDTTISPGADLTGLSYDRGADNVNATDDTSDELYAQGVTVSNNVVPSIQSAEVTSANPDRILVTYDGPVQSGDADVVGDFAATGSISLSAGSADFTAGTDSQLALPLTGSVAAGDGDVGNLDYDSAGGADGVESTAGVDAQVPDNNNDIANNVEPIIQSATVQDGAPGEVQVTFRENVVKNATGSPNGNIDSAVTEAFEFENSEVDLRIKNVQNIGTDTVTLNFGAEDGTSQEVKATDDLTDALSYDPEGPTEEAEKQPLTADGGTSAAVPQTQNLDVTNNVDVDLSVAKIVTDGQEIRVTFTEDVTKVGTVSEIEDAFDVGQSAVTIDGSNTFAGIENGDTVVFNNSLGSDFVATPGSYHSGTDFGVDTPGNGLKYVASTGNNPLEDATGTAVPDFGTGTRKDITNNIQPRIVSATVTNGDRDEIQLTYTEDITGSDSNAYESFSLDGNQAPSITGQNGESTNTIDLDLDSAVAKGDDLGTLTYTDSDSSDEIKSGETGSNQIALDGDSVDVTNSVGDAPVLQNVTIDDAGVNNNYGTNGEMLLAFDQAVVESSDTTSGLTFDSGLEGVSVSTVDVKDPGASPNNVIIVTYTSDSGSASSNIQATDDLSGATLTVGNAANVGITGDAPDNNQITENTVSDVSNEIAGSPATITSTDVNAELLGTESDEEGSYTVTVTGVEDADGNRVIDDTIGVDIGSKDNAVSVGLNRFSDSAATTDSSPTVTFDTSSVDVGSQATVDVGEASVQNTDTIQFVHEAYTAGSTGYVLTSQPMPGEVVIGNEANNGINDVSQYNATGNAYENYADTSEVEEVHRALFLHAQATSDEYGFAYDEDRSGTQTNVGSLDMSEGWHVVGSNYDVDPTDGTTGSIALSVDLSLANDPNSNVVNVQDDSLPGTTLSNSYQVDNNEAYYVYLQQGDDRPIVLPEYDGSS